MLFHVSSLSPVSFIRTAQIIAAITDAAVTRKALNVNQGKPNGPIIFLPKVCLIYNFFHDPALLVSSESTKRATIIITPEAMC